VESELQKLLEQLNQLNQQENLEQKLALFEQVNERFTSITAQKTAKLDQALMLKIIEAYQQFIQTAQESKTSLSKEIARLNQENQALKKYVPLEELSGIELYY
jgi:predicted  nucleic acid-binding Zn-ribbon protein